MKLRTTLLAAMGCLFALATSCKDPDDNTPQYATNKAGERLVESIQETYGDNRYNYHITYNDNGSIRKIVEDFYDGDTDYECDRRVYSFEKRNHTLYLRDSSQDGIYETSFDLNTNGQIVLDRGWNGNHNYRLTYDESGKYLHNVFDGDKLIWTFQWEDGNILNKEVTYTMQAHPSNIDWCAYFQTWRIHETQENENLVELSSICLFWGFSDGYLGAKCKGLPTEDRRFGTGTYTYDFDEDGFISAIYTSHEWRKCEIHVTYRKK